MQQTAGSARIEALDVVRGAAVCGILLVTIVKMGSLTEYGLDGYPAHPSASWIAWGVQTVFVEGAMRGLFTMLFGASMMLMLRRAEGPNGVVTPIDLWARRSLALIGFGFILWLAFFWPGEILTNYGIAGLFLLAFRTSRPRTLFLTAVAILTVLSMNGGYRTFQEAAQLQQGRAAAVAVAAGLPIGADDRRALAATRTEWAALHPTTSDLARRHAERTQLHSLLKWSEGFWLGENIGGSGWLEVAESVAFMLIGMALYRLGVLTGAAPTGTYAMMVFVGYGVGVAGRMLPVVLGVRAALDLSAPVVSPGWWTLSAITFEPFRLLVTIGHVGAILWLFKAGWLGRATPLRALGRMALTVYSLQAVIGSALFYGFGLVGHFHLAGLWAIAVAIWIATAAFARMWLAHFAMGPAERLLRVAAYGRADRAGARDVGPALVA